MLRLFFLTLLTLATTAVLYLPHSQQGAKLSAQPSTLQIEMTHTAGMMIDRLKTDNRLRFHSEQVHYDEAQDLSLFEPYHFTGISADNFFDGKSQQARIQGNRLELNQDAVLKQATKTGETRTLSSQQLIMDTHAHTIHSPEALRVSDSKQTILADSLSGNYEEGSYEFTHHVQSHWQ